MSNDGTHPRIPFRSGGQVSIDDPVRQADRGVQPGPPQPTRSRGLRWWAWTLIAVGAVAVVSIPVVGVLAYVQHSLQETSPDQPFADGPEQTPDAKTPLDCLQRCFALDAADALAVSADDLSSLPITDQLNGVGAFEPSTVAAAAKAGKDWVAMGGDEECAFLPANAPYIVLGPDSTSDDPISWVQTWETDDEVMDLSARSFESTADATAFMRDLHDRVAACPWQDLSVPSAGGADSTLVQISSPAAIDVPDEVAAVGWVREGTPGPRWRSYVWDLQRGNLVVQVRILTDGRILEPQVASFAELMAERLGDLTSTAPR